MSNPKVNPVVLISPVEEGYVAYDPKQDCLHRLNPIAALLTELCTGERSVEEIQGLVAPLLPEGKGGEIARWIDDATKAGLLVTEGSEAASIRELTAGELNTLTKRLTEMGKVQSAYLCGKRAVELNPNDADAWYNLGEVAQCVGKREDARHAYGKYLEAHPDDGEIEHLLIALSDDAPPPRASDRAIHHIYKTFAATYDTRMVDDLKYTGPQRIMEAITAVIGDKANLNVLELGCGSGLSGAAIRPRAAELTGIDLSPEMVELSRARNIYDKLDVAEITSYLAENREAYDLVLSCDCLIYFGDLTEVAIAVSKHLKDGAIFAFSNERGNKYPYQLTDTGRYAHHPDHIRDVAAKSGLTLAYINESFLRFEYGVEVMGLFAVLRKDVKG